MQLVSVTTSDLVRLHGMYLPSKLPHRVSPSKGFVDAAVLVHGIGGNFYSSRLLLKLAEMLNGIGVSVVLINTRGYEMVNTLSWGGQARTVGAAFEKVSDCQYDLTAWHDFLIDRGHGNVLFLGHSLGAIKSLFAAAEQAPQKLKSIVAVSPSRLSYRRMLETSTDGLFRQTFERCKALVNDGRGNDPVQVEFPVRTWMTPNCYLDKYGPDEKYNWLNFIERVQQPSLLVFGQRELDSHPGFIGVENDLESSRKKWMTVDVQIIPEADHFYSGNMDLLEDAILRWLLN